jgi:cation-transporting ATPase E
VVVFSLPLARKAFMLDPSNVALTTTALAIGVVAAALIEIAWWVQGRILGEKRRLWRSD